MNTSENSSPFMKNRQTTTKEVEPKRELQGNEVRILTLIDFPALVNITKHIEESTNQQLGVRGLIAKMTNFIVKPTNKIPIYYKAIAFGSSNWEDREDTKYVKSLLDNSEVEFRTFEPKIGGGERCVDVALSSTLWTEEDNYDIVHLIIADSDYIPAIQAAKEKGKKVVYTHVDSKHIKSAKGLGSVATSYDIEKFIYIINNKRERFINPYRKS